MKRQIRRGVFETNSSSTHSLTMMMKSEYERWRREGLYLYSNGWGWEFSQPVKNQLYTRDEAVEFARKNKYYKDVEEIDGEVLKDIGFISWDNLGCDSLEEYYGEFITPSGETVVAFGEYGYDG